MKSILTPKFIFLSVVVILAALSRLLPHPPNFTPVAAMALFGGAYYQDKKMSFLMPMLAMFISDIVIGFHSTMLFVYSGFIFIVIIGLQMKNRIKPLNIIAASLASSILFFIISNFGVWVSGGYPQNIAGLLECYTMAIPFFKNTLLGDLFYCWVMFGGYEIAKAKIPALSRA